jgi:hypothetical protein
MPLSIDIGPDGLPEIVDLERVGVATVIDDPDPKKCQVLMPLVDGVGRAIKGNHAKRVIQRLREFRDKRAD